MYLRAWYECMGTASWWLAWLLRAFRRANAVCFCILCHVQCPLTPAFFCCRNQTGREGNADTGLIKVLGNQQLKMRSMHCNCKLVSCLFCIDMLMHVRNRKICLSKAPTGLPSFKRTVAT